MKDAHASVVAIDGTSFGGTPLHVEIARSAAGDAFVVHFF